MRAFIISLLSILVPFGAASQGTFGFGYAVATVDGKISKTIFVTDVVNLDSLSGNKNIIHRSKRYRLKAYNKSLKRLVLSLIEQQDLKLLSQSELEFMNQIELHPDPGFSSKVQRINKEFGFERDVAFMIKVKADRRRVRMLTGINTQGESDLILLRK